MDNIKIVKGDKSNKITLNRSVGDLIQDSDDDIGSDNNSISTAEPIITPINKKDKIKKPIPMMPQINQDQFNYFINNKIILNAIQTGKIKHLTVGSLLMSIIKGSALPGKPMIKILIQALKLLIKGAKYKKIFVFNTHKTNLTKRV